MVSWVGYGIGDSVIFVEIIQIGEERVIVVKYMQFYYFKWYDICNELCVDGVLVWVIIYKVIFDDLLVEGFVGDSVGIINF